MQILLFSMVGWTAYAACTAILGAIDRVVHEGGKQ